jgi:hypothetical protein
MKTIDIARICHEANRTFCEIHGDNTQVPWNDAPEHIRASAQIGVQFFLDHPDATPEMQHNSWMMSKLADGWHYGEVKDSIALTHPCIVPYYELPAMQQAKDVLFQAVIKAMRNV